MLFEATTLSAVARLVAETLETDYATDPRPVFADAGLDYSRLAVAGARYPWRNMQLLWRKSVDVTGDACFGLHAGKHVRPTTFHAIGYSWLASQSLLGSLKRLCRYMQVVSTAPVSLSIERSGDNYVLSAGMVDPTHQPIDVTVDAFVVAVTQLCRTATNGHFAPAAVELQRPDNGAAAEYVAALNCPVHFGADTTQILFDRDSLEAPLPGDNSDIARANDKVAERMLEGLEPHKVASAVREILVTLLPSGQSSQSLIAQRMHRSLSTLQRQLQHEGTSYQELRDTTRRTLAEDYVRDDELTLSQIAYMLGFSDQSNFSRAFKRWTGQTPREFRHQTES